MQASGVFRSPAISSPCRAGVHMQCLQLKPAVQNARFGFTATLQLCPFLGTKASSLRCKIGGFCRLQFVCRVSCVVARCLRHIRAGSDCTMWYGSGSGVLDYLEPASRRLICGMKLCSLNVSDLEGAAQKHDVLPDAFCSRIRRAHVDCTPWPLLHSS